MPGVWKRNEKTKARNEVRREGGAALLREKQLGMGSRQEQRRPGEVPVTWERRLGFPSERHSDGVRIREGAGHTHNKATSALWPVQNEGEGEGQEPWSQGPLTSGRPAGTRPSCEWQSRLLDQAKRHGDRFIVAPTEAGRGR